MSRLTLRPETANDYKTIEHITREAFWNHHGPGCNEHYLLHLLRAADAFIPELDYVAHIDGTLAGSIVYSRAHILDVDGYKHPVITFGPLSVDPIYQGIGIGSKLVTETLAKAKDMGFKAVIIYGDPAYYSRLGFGPAEAYRITTPDNMYGGPLQALELEAGYLKAIGGGRFYEDPVFHVDADAAADYDQNFPPKEKLEGLPSQLAFQSQIKSFRPKDQSNEQ